VEAVEAVDEVIKDAVAEVGLSEVVVYPRKPLSVHVGFSGQRETSRKVVASRYSRLA
jgi:hypothetical protein